MRFYATIESAESEKGGSRAAKKGSNEQLNITLYRGNREIGLLTFSGDEVSVEIYGSEPYCLVDGVEAMIPSAMVYFPR